MIGMIFIMLQLCLLQLGLTGTAIVGIGLLGDILIGISVLLCVISVIQYIKVNKQYLNE